MDAVSLLARLVLSVTFAIAGITKALDLAGTRQSMLDFGSPEPLAGLLARLLPVAELACALALLPASTAVWGATGTLALLLLFIVVISLSLARGRQPECYCFGQLHSAPVGWKTLVRNLILSGMADLVILEARDQQSPGYGDWLGGLGRFESTVLALSLAIAALALLWLWSVLHLMRQNGRLLLRLDAIETQLGMRPAPPPPGLPVNSAAPAFRLSTLDGGITTVESLSRAKDALLLIFTQPGCGPCDALMPEVARWQQKYADRLSIVLISRGKLEVNRAKAAEFGVSNFFVQLNDEPARTYQAEGTPSAVLLRKGLVASPVSSGSEAINALMAVAIQPPPLSQGETVPELALRDLDGEMVDLHSLRGRRHLLLFWNPDCGFCQDMLPDIQAWESRPPKDGPQLLVISSGARDANRAQGFRAPVVLDRGFRVGNLFGVEGTPAAVLIDEEGRVASGAKVGAVDVLALAQGAHDGLKV